MFQRRMIAAAIGAAMFLGLAGLAADLGAGEKDKKDKKDEPRKGTIVGVITAKNEKNTAIEIKADGEEKSRKYIPHWRGGAPAAGGGPDKDMVKTISKLTVGSRVRIDWEFEEHFRVVKVEGLKAAEAKDKGDDKKEEKKGKEG